MPTRHVNEYFQQALESDDPPLAALARAYAWASPFLTDDDDRRAIGDSYYPLLLRAFQEHNHDSHVAVFDRAQIGLSLKSNGDLDVAVTASAIKFDWSAAQTVLFQLHRLTEDIKAWIPERKERRTHSDETYSIALFVASAINIENSRHSRHSGSVDNILEPPSAAFHHALLVIAPEIAEAQRRFQSAAERRALSHYAVGMLYGVIGLVVVTAVGGGVFALEGIQARYGIGVVAGGLGATVSVLQRMTPLKGCTSTTRRRAACSSRMGR